MARPKQFKAESKRLLDLMIHSIYTNKEIFLRELISNASDAQDKLYFKSLQDGSLDIDRSGFKITLSVDEDKRTLTVTDNGIGMTKEELENNLGTIAKSDSHAFKQALEGDVDEVDVIGQFGVGFYSAFMVSSKVQVISKSFGTDQAYEFSSNGLEGFTIASSDYEPYGTQVICTIKENSDEENYDQFLKTHQIRQLIKKYSDYIRHPIVLLEEDNETVLNSMVPLWKRSKSDVSDEELNQFYKDKFHDYTEPFKTLSMHVEGNPSFDALLFIPGHVPANFYSAQYETGLQLYSRGVFIMEHNKALLPEHFRFVKGLVDSPDLSLNISREILQHDRQLTQIASRIEKKLIGELGSMLKNNRPQYEELWNQFGLSLKYGVYAEFGANKEKLQDLLLFHSSTASELTSLQEYVERMKEDQTDIYFVSGDSLEKCAALPQTELVISKGYEVLYLVDDIDEFVMQILHEYQEKHFKSVNQGDLDLSDDKTKKEIEKKTEETKDLLAAIKESLSDKVDDVVISQRLVNHPVCLVSAEGISFEMEKVLNAMPDKQQEFKAQRILEINPSHPLLSALEKIYDKKPDALEDYAHLLFDQACLIEGLPIEDPALFSKKLAGLMVEAVEKL